MKKRITSLFLVLVLAVGNPSVTVWAAENEELNITAEQEETLISEDVSDSLQVELPIDDYTEELSTEADIAEEAEIFEEYPDGLIEIEEDEEDLDFSDEEAFDFTDEEAAVIDASSDDMGDEDSIELSDASDADESSDLIVFEDGEVNEVSDTNSMAVVPEDQEEESSEEKTSEFEDSPANLPEGMVLTERQEMKTVIPGGGDDSDELFEAYMERAVFGLVPSSPKKLRSSARLTGTEAVIYSRLLPQIQAVAAGERTSTVFTIEAEDMGFEKLSWTAEELGVSSLIETVDGKTVISADAKSALAEHTYYDFNLVLRALLSTCPYELYWFDKTAGTSYGGLMIRVTTDQDLNELVICYSGEASFSFAVSAGYRAGQEAYEVDPDAVQTAQSAAANADQIISNNAGLPDDEKLRAYKNAICGLVDYNHPAAGGGTSYGDPWQLVWVFDGDDSTTVVCEGYSKAFQYLFDKSTFNNSIECYTVTGGMDGGTGAGAHMWNIVRMEDQRNYMADVTNSDAGTVGSSGNLFLASTNLGNVASGYTFPCGSKNIVYTYDDKTINYFGTDILTLSSTPYEAHQHTLVPVAAVPATCTSDGNTAYWYCSGCARYYSDSEGTHSITQAETVAAKTGHSFTHVNGVDATCTSGGNFEYWYCDKCQNYYADANGSAQITFEETKIAALGHSFDHTEAKAATCTSSGNIEYWHCDRCENYYTDANGSAQITLEETKTAVLGHSFDHVNEVSKTCTADGHIEYWYCAKCGNYYTDAEGTVQTTLDATVIPKGHTPGETVTEAGQAATCESAGSHVEVVCCADCGEEISRKTVTDPRLPHTLSKHFERRETSLDENGNIEYWQCEVCGGFFTDAAGTKQIAREQTVIPRLINISDAVVTGIADKTYTGSAITQTPSVAVGASGSTLVKGTDYDISYKDNTNVGTATAEITGKGRYAGTKTVTFKISPKTITPSVALSASSFTWSGSAPNPAVTVKDGNKVLKAGTDYTAPVLTGNVNAGTYTVKVNLKGNYAGSGSASYTINAKAVTPTVTLSKASYTWNNAVQTPAVTVKSGSTVLQQNTDYTVTLPSGRKAAGTYTIKVTLKGNYSGSGSASYKITPKKITPVVTLAATAYTYDGKVKKPAVTVKDGKTKLAAGNYKVTYASGRKNVGVYKVTVTMKGNYSGSKAVSFKINPKKTVVRSVISPAKGALKVTWVQQAVQTTGYQIQYSLNKNFGSGTKTITVKGPKVITRNITGLRGGKIYYVRVRTFRTISGKHYFSAWSPAKYRAVRNR